MFGFIEARTSWSVPISGYYAAAGSDGCTWGGIGAALRYLTSEWITSDGFPWATLCVNLIGSFLMGALAIGLAENMISKDLALLLGTGCSVD